MTADHFDALARASSTRLEKLLRAGSTPTLSSLVGFEWRGLNTAWQPRLLGLQKFVKGFFELTGRLEGYNIPVAQNGLAGPWQPLPTSEQPRRYAFFHVRPVEPGSPDSRYPQALLLDYGASHRNADAPWLARRLRDYLVQPDAAQPNLLLGKAYLALGQLRLPSSFFILERLRPTSWTP